MAKFCLRMLPVTAIFLLFGKQAVPSAYPTKQVTTVLQMNPTVPHCSVCLLAVKITVVSTYVACVCLGSRHGVCT